MDAVKEAKEVKIGKLKLFKCYCKNNAKKSTYQKAERWAVNPKTDQVQFFVGEIGDDAGLDDKGNKRFLKEGENIVCSLLDSKNWVIEETDRTEIKECLNCGAELP